MQLEGRIVRLGASTAVNLKRHGIRLRRLEFHHNPTRKRGTRGRAVYHPTPTPSWQGRAAGSSMIQESTSMKSRYHYGLCILILAASASGPWAFAESELELSLRRQVETSPGSGRYHTTAEDARWDPAKTAIVICDMWNEHWCRGATARVAEMAPRMNQVVAEARRRGVLIIHCPSGCMKRYQGTAQRQLAQRRRRSRPSRRCGTGAIWMSPARALCRSTTPTEDATASPPALSEALGRIRSKRSISGRAMPSPTARGLLPDGQRGIEQVIVMGVHTNMCVLGRPFSIRQMIYQGMNVVLMRDLTDTMYNSQSRPFVNHHTGTELVIEHIERHWRRPSLGPDRRR